MGQHGCNEHAATPAPVGTYDCWRVAFHVFPLKHLLLYVLPFPKGAPTAPALKPELKPDVVASFEEERAALLELIERIGTGLRNGFGPDHPLFGPLSWREWGVVTYKHADHHLKQFGV